MFESPHSLQTSCLDYICENIEALCEVQAVPDAPTSTSMVFKMDDVYFHSNLANLLLACLSDRKKLTDDVMTLFDSSVTSLSRVHIRDAPLSTKGLRILKNHKITELEVTGLPSNVTVNDLIGCLGEWTLANLRCLNVANSTFMNSAKFCVMVSLSKLKSLQTLNVSNTEFNKHGLEIIASDLPALENLDISGTPVNDLGPLRKCKNRLKSLAMYNLRASHTEDIVPVLCELQNLRHLDVSDDSSTQQTFVNLQHVKFGVQDLLIKTRCLPNLTSLDISGKEEVNVDLLRSFVLSHRQLKFLGLALTEACRLSMFGEPDNFEYMPDIVVTGDATEAQLLEALRRYSSRQVYVQKSLYHLFSITQSLQESRTDVIKLILQAMKNHPKDLGVQMAATACLYNMSKGDLGAKIHPHWLANILTLTMAAMEVFPHHQQLQKNALLTLCSDRILQDVTFDRFRCAKLVMECLCMFDDPSMNRMSVAICSILAAKIPTEQTSLLGSSSKYMKKLLKIVEDKKKETLADITMKFTLSALWNLTDESPSTCDTFLKEGGLTLFMDVLEAYKNLEDNTRTQVETKVLGLINNLAEVQQLRKELMTRDVLEQVRKLLGSKHIDVSYFAAGIVSHLLVDDIAWPIEHFTKHDLLTDLGTAVLQWEQPETEMVAYRSFNPFFPLLRQHDAPQVQLWAVWAIQHVCLRNDARYCPMLVNEGGVDILQGLVNNPRTQRDVVNLCSSVLGIVNKKVPGILTCFTQMLPCAGNYRTVA